MSAGPRVLGLGAAYGRRRVFQNLDLRLPAERTSVLLGPGGGGKSTLLRALGCTAFYPSGLETEGEIRLPIENPCLLPQDPERGSRTVAELLSDLRCAGAPCFWARQALLTREGDAECRPLADSLKRFWRCAPEAAKALGGHLDARLDHVSGELLRLAAFTATVSHGSPYLLLDEPTAEMRPQLLEWVVEKLRRLRGTRTIVIVTRDLRVAQAVADFAVLLADGKIVEAGDAGPFFQRPQHSRTRHFITMGC